MEPFDIIVNQLPVKTWNHLRMNETAVPQVALNAPAVVTAAGVSPQLSPNCPPSFAAIPTGSGKDVSALLSAAAIPAQVMNFSGTEHAARLTVSFPAGEATGAQLLLSLEEGAAATLVMDFTAPAASAGTGLVQTKIQVGKNAVLRLVQVQRVGEDFTFFNDLGADCAQGGRVELIQLVLSGSASYLGCQATLTGDASALDVNVAYALSGQQKLDMNYVARHLGKKSESNLFAAGSLADQSAKLFRGTIDFVNGCAGAVGNEKEEVLLMDETTVNQTIPLILCAEEDVEGNHGASIGKPDEEVLFYLSARGIPETTAYALLAGAKLSAAAGKIWDEHFRQEILAAIKGGAQDE